MINIDVHSWGATDVGNGDGVKSVVVNKRPPRTILFWYHHYGKGLLTLGLVDNLLVKQHTYFFPVDYSCFCNGSIQPQYTRSGCLLLGNAVLYFVYLSQLIILHFVDLCSFWRISCWRSIDRLLEFKFSIEVTIAGSSVADDVF